MANFFYTRRSADRGTCRGFFFLEDVETKFGVAMRYRRSKVVLVSSERIIQ